VTSTGPPPAEGVRVHWDGLPERVRAAIERWLASPVVSAVTQPGGFSPGLAARLLTADGRRVFVKAVGPELNPDAPRFHRREGAIVAALPTTAPVPRLLWSYDEGETTGEADAADPGGWVALAFEDVEGRHPAQPWQPDELDRVLAALDALGESLTPSPLPSELTVTAGEWLARHGRGWRRLLTADLEIRARRDAWSVQHEAALAELESQAPDAAHGDTLLHFDTRADNMLLTPERVYIVDWPHARVGQPWVEIILFAPSVAMQGGPSPEALFQRHRAARTADPAAITAVVAAVAGFFTWNSLLPAPPGLPTLRAFQAAQGAVARHWLAYRLGIGYEV
jgi:aminoglycoside phosphotransferase (APT) family kinase protein